MMSKRWWFFWVFISTALFGLAGMADGFVQAMLFHYGDMANFVGDNHQFWNPQISWMNKYSDVATLTPKYFGSTTFLVFLTDAYHLFRFAFFTLLLFGWVVVLAINNVTTLYIGRFGLLMWPILLYLARSTGFHIVYTVIF